MSIGERVKSVRLMAELSQRELYRFPLSRKPVFLCNSRVRWYDCSFRLGIVGKRREGVQVLTKQGDEISLRFLL